MQVLIETRRPSAARCPIVHPAIGAWEAIGIAAGYVSSRQRKLVKENGWNPTVRASRRALRALLSTRPAIDGIKKRLILRRPPTGPRVRAVRTAPIQPIVNFLTCSARRPRTDSLVPGIYRNRKRGPRLMDVHRSSPGAEGPRPSGGDERVKRCRSRSTMFPLAEPVTGT